MDNIQWISGQYPFNNVFSHKSFGIIILLLLSYSSPLPIPIYHPCHHRCFRRECRAVAGVVERPVQGRVGRFSFISCSVEKTRFLCLGEEGLIFKGWLEGKRNFLSYLTPPGVVSFLLLLKIWLTKKSF